MQGLSRKISEFIERNHVVGLAVLDTDGVPWAANCFYVFDEEDVSLVILSRDNTRHAAAMAAHPRIAGTISGQIHKVKDIQGVQFKAEALLTEGADRKSALRLYYRKFPFARLVPADVWRLRLGSVKFTDNTIVFGHKTLWSRPSG